MIPFDSVSSLLPYGIVYNYKRKYSENILGNQEEPCVYNEKGEKKRVFYLKDELAAHTPYSLVLGQMPESILWDRYNVGLPIHFYTHKDVFSQNNKNSKKKFALFFESEAIKNSDYEYALYHPEVMKTYDLIFTFSDKLLETYDNARFAPACGLWYGSTINGGELDQSRYKKKCKNISVISSNKSSSKYHEIRLKIAKEALSSKLVDGYGEFCGNRIEKKSIALDDYRYSIVVENDVKPYYFTEKILDCFASMTIPIYIGATKIDKYFNKDGIIFMNENDKISDILSQCTNDYYNNHLDSIMDNFNRVLEYRCIEDYIFNLYFNEFVL